MKSYIDNVIAPRLQGDGGWIEYEDFDGDCLKVILRGDCSTCAKNALCIKWVEEKILRDRGEKVTIEYQCIKPFFRDK